MRPPNLSENISLYYSKRPVIALEFEYLGANEFKQLLSNQKNELARIAPSKKKTFIFRDEPQKIEKNLLTISKSDNTKNNKLQQTHHIDLTNFSDKENQETLCQNFANLLTIDWHYKIIAFFTQLLTNYFSGLAEAHRKNAEKLLNEIFKNLLCISKEKSLSLKQLHNLHQFLNAIKKTNGFQSLLVNRSHQKVLQELSLRTAFQRTLLMYQQSRNNKLRYYIQDKREILTQESCILKGNSKLQRMTIVDTLFTSIQKELNLINDKISKDANPLAFIKKLSRLEATITDKKSILKSTLKKMREQLYDEVIVQQVGSNEKANDIWKYYLKTHVNQYLCSMIDFTIDAYRNNYTKLVWKDVLPWRLFSKLANKIRFRFCAKSFIAKTTTQHHFLTLMKARLLNIKNQTDIIQAYADILEYTAYMSIYMPEFDEAFIRHFIHKIQNTILRHFPPNLIQNYYSNQNESSTNPFNTLPLALAVQKTGNSQVPPSYQSILKNNIKTASKDSITEKTLAGHVQLIMGFKNEGDEEANNNNKLAFKLDIFQNQLTTRLVALLNTTKILSTGKLKSIDSYKADGHFGIVKAGVSAMTKNLPHAHPVTSAALGGVQLIYDKVSDNTEITNNRKIAQITPLNKDVDRFCKDLVFRLMKTYLFVIQQLDYNSIIPFVDAILTRIEQDALPKLAANIANCGSDEQKVKNVPIQCIDAIMLSGRRHGFFGLLKSFIVIEGSNPKYPEKVPVEYLLSCGQLLTKQKSKSGYKKFRPTNQALIKSHYALRVISKKSVVNPEGNDTFYEKINTHENVNPISTLSNTLQFFKQHFKPKQIAPTPSQSPPPKT